MVDFVVFIVKITKPVFGAVYCTVVDIYTIDRASASPTENRTNRLKDL